MIFQGKREDEITKFTKKLRERLNLWECQCLAIIRTSIYFHMNFESHTIRTFLNVKVGRL